MVFRSSRRAVASIMRLAGFASLAFSGFAFAQSSASSPTTTAAPPSSNDTTGPFLPVLEVDVIFPLNETYQETEILPVAINVQRLPEVRNVGELSFIWNLDVYDPDHKLGVYNDLDSGLFVPANTSEGTIQLGHTNMTSWISKLNYTSHVLLTVNALWNFTYLCDHPARGGTAMTSILFRVESDIQRASQPDNSSIPADVVQAPDCPVFGAILSDYASSTVYTHILFAADTTSTAYTTCSTLLDVETASSYGTPCAATVDAATRSALGSMASSLATGQAQASEASQSSRTAKPTSTSTSGALATGAAQLQSALAAVAVVYCIVYN
ncbi:uncharacterized protein SPSK_06469 [Sporothrix schenckii 1099-18]|uniref:DUF7136 domain-containing protein n=1 Tax=Sporothrix schenckii 1099-18 TaxID=1397361 RepID=A0A0F2MI04_SPOSC|nr:uncharacterized protein SPSK_06469 [Sporothrix schenckii 1099-18]KJR89333.1 hypothetical protein SPSK_06469 [Sporothrix schenckii 1099-18]